MKKKINYLLLLLSTRLAYASTGSDFSQALKPSNFFGNGGGSITSSLATGPVKSALLGSAWVLAIAMIITVMAAGVFNHNESIMKSVLKVLVTLVGLAILIYWGTSVVGGA